MKLTKSLKKTLSAFCILGFAQFASAGVISLGTATGLTADIISVDLVWDGTVPVEHLGDWEVDISFDESIVEFQDVTFGIGLDPFGLGSLFGSDQTSVLGVSTVNLFEISLDGPGDVIAHQNGLGNSFVLATLQFLAVGVGEANLALSLVISGDENGFPFNTPTAVEDGQICVGPACDPAVVVPTPSSLPLVMLALLGLFGLRRKRTS